MCFSGPLSPKARENSGEGRLGYSVRSTWVKRFWHNAHPWRGAMDQITSEIVEETWKRMAAMSGREAQELAKLFVKQQPVVASYLLVVDSDVLNQDERQLLFYLGTVVWQMMSQGKTPLPTVTEDDLSGLRTQISRWWNICRARQKAALCKRPKQ